jgi:hypothetical protein
MNDGLMVVRPDGTIMMVRGKSSGLGLSRSQSGYQGWVLG